MQGGQQPAGSQCKDDQAAAAETADSWVFGLIRSEILQSLSLMQDHTAAELARVSGAVTEMQSDQIR